MPPTRARTTATPPAARVTAKASAARRGPLLLAGDIGGTKTALALISAKAGPSAPVAQATFPSGDYPSLEAVVHAFLNQNRAMVTRAIFGVPGPVVGGRAQATNLPWVVDERHLKKTLHLSSILLINDLAATATAVPYLRPGDVRTLNAGLREAGGAIAVIAPGTGLGEAFLTWDGARYRAHPSEGGHADFAPGDDRQAGLLAYLRAKGGHVSYERVCSGRGLPHIYAYLRQSGAGEEPPWLTARLAEARDPAPVIIEAALSADPACPLAAATLEIFVSILGAEAGNLALKVLATGGVYVGGGIPPRILPALGDGRFMQAFCRKGRLSDLLYKIPVHVILHSSAALVGAAYAGLGM